MLAELLRRLDAHGFQTLVVAYSGGLDSTVLLHLTSRAARHRPLDVVAVHVDHGLRPNSHDDARHCAATAHHLGLPFRGIEITVASDHSRQHQARAQRYAALERIAANVGASAIATAHHADDHLETALLHAERSWRPTSVASLALPTTLRPSGLHLWRPLLGFTRRAIRRYAEDRDLSWREDPTNTDLGYRRNRIRHEVIPALFPTEAAKSDALKRLDVITREAEAIRHEARALLRNARLTTPIRDERKLAREPLAVAPISVLEEAFRLILRQIEGAYTGEDSLTEIVRAVRSAAATRVCVHGAVVETSARDVFVQRNDGQGTRSVDAREAHPLTLPAAGRGVSRERTWFEWRIRVGAARGSDAGDSWQVRVQPTGELRVRGPRPGDRLDIAGMSGRKRVVDVLREAGVSAAERWRWPILVDATDDGERCIAVAGVRRSDHAVDADAGVCVQFWNASLVS